MNKNKALFDCPCGETHIVNFGKSPKKLYLCKTLDAKLELVKVENKAYIITE